MTVADTELTDRSDRTPPTPLVGVVVPTYNECDNIEVLLARLAPAVRGMACEVVFVDDSTDDTPQVITRLAETSPVPVRLVHRMPGERIGGLGGAVLTGLHTTRAAWVVVMDADLQHPPELVPDLLQAAVAHDADVVVASRYVGAGSAAGLANRRRRTVSRAAAALARMLFPRRLGGCSDPMSGFFLVRTEALPLDRLRPHGFKILLEILARTARARVAEVPFTFDRRLAGESKADLQQGLAYVRQLLRLRTGGMPARLAGFLAVGLTGVLPNLATMAVLGHLGSHYLPAAAAATLVAATSNFLLTDALVFRGRSDRSKRERWAGYVGLSVVDILLRLPLMAVLVERLRLGTLSATLASILAAGALRFLVVDRWLYRADPSLLGQAGDVLGAAQAAAPSVPSVHGHRALREAIARAT